MPEISKGDFMKKKLSCIIFALFSMFGWGNEGHVKLNVNELPSIYLGKVKELNPELINAMLMAGINGAGNGGDSCEESVLSIAYDIHKWILSGGHNSLRSSNSKDVSYGDPMLNAIKNLKVSCTNMPIVVNGSEKTCINFVEKESSYIVCNDERYQRDSKTEKYTLVHHELAGLAGLEKSSEYHFSKQIKYYLEDVVIKQLSSQRIEENIQDDRNISNIPTGSELIFKKDIFIKANQSVIEFQNESLLCSIVLLEKGYDRIIPSGYAIEVLDSFKRFERVDSVIRFNNENEDSSPIDGIVCKGMKNKKRDFRFSIKMSELIDLIKSDLDLVIPDAVTLN